MEVFRFAVTKEITLEYAKLLFRTVEILPI